VAGRSPGRARGGHTNIVAAIATADARPQPSKRSGITEAGAGTFSERMKQSRAANAPAARERLIRPEKRIANPTTAIAQVLATALREQAVPNAISGKPTAASVR